MKNTFFPRTILQSLIYMIVYFLIIGIPLILLIHFEMKNTLSDNLCSATFSVIFIALFYYKNKISFNIKSEIRVIKKARLLPIFMLFAAFHMSIVGFKGLLCNTEELIKGTNHLWSIEMLIGALILGPLLEELIFRSILLRGLLKKNSPRTSIFISAVLFASIHIDVYNFDILKVLTALAFGILVGYCFYKTYSTALCVILHFFANLLAIACSLLHLPVYNSSFGITFYWSILIVSLLSLSFLIFFYKKKILPVS